MENDWESKIDEWLSNKSSRYIGKIWQVVVELEDERDFLGNRFRVPMHRRRFEEGKPLEGTIRTLYTLAIKGFIQVDQEPLTANEIDIFRNSKTEIELTGGFKYLHDWLEPKVHQDSSKTTSMISTNRVNNKKPNWKQQTEKRAILVLPDGKKLSFWGGSFGGLNILFKNFGKDVTRSQLRAEIYKNLQQDKKLSKNQIKISAWISDLKRNRKPFFAYFEIERYEPNFYSLIWASRKKSTT